MRLFGVVCLSISSFAVGQTYTISTFAGGGPLDGTPGTSVALNQVRGVASDPAGNAFILTSDSVLRLDAATGTVNRLIPVTGGTAIAADSFGNVYVSVLFGSRIQRISNGIVTTVAGTGERELDGNIGDNGPATSAQLMGANGLAVDAAGNLYIADSGNQRIRRVSNGIITTIAGNPVCRTVSGAGLFGFVCDAGFSGDGGPATSAKLSSPSEVAVDTAGNVYIADTGNGRIRKVSSGIITTIAGGGTDPSDNIAAVNAAISSAAVTLDAAENLYVLGNHGVRKISNGIITTVVGNGTAGYSGDNGPAIGAQTNAAFVASDAAGDLYIGESTRIRKVVSGIITTVAGNGELAFSGDGGPAVGAVLQGPGGVAVDAAGNLYISDALNHRVRKVSNGVITTVAGNGTAGFSGDGGLATDASIDSPASLAVDSAGNLYILDLGNNRIRKVTNGVVTTVVGDSFFPGLHMGGIAVDPAGNLYFSVSDISRPIESRQTRVRMVTNGQFTTVAGTGIAGFSGDGGPATAAQLTDPEAIAFDAAGNLYIIDASRVRKISNGVITTVAGNSSGNFGGDGGPATTASGSFSSIAIDSAGNLYFTDITFSIPLNVYMFRVREVSNGVIDTIAGTGTNGFSGDNGPALSAQLNGVGALAVDAAGHVYIADSGNNRIRVLTPVLGPDLTITNVHNGTFTSGQVRASYTITVGNGGTAFTVGTVTVTETAPSLMVVTSMTGSGWNCIQPKGPCTREDRLAPLSRYPVITVTVNIDGASPVVAAVNTATVAGGSEVYTTNDTALDSVIIPLPAPLITSISPNPVTFFGNSQTLFINGIGLSGLRTLRLTGPTGQIDLPNAPPVKVFSDFQLSIPFPPFMQVGNWTVQVIRLDGESNAFPFTYSTPVTTSFALPQFVFGGAWYTALYFSNTTADSQTFTVGFIGDDGAPLNVPLAGIGILSSYTVTVNPRSTVILEALNNSGISGQGWVETHLQTGVIGYAVFRQVVPGRADQEALVPLTPESSQIADLTYDETLFSTAVALLNPSSQPEVVTITAFGTDGTPAGTAQIPLAPRFKLATVLRTMPGLEGILGKRGRAVFSVSSGAVSVMGLRFGGSAFTSIPAVHRPAVPDTNSMTLALPQFVFGDPWATAIYLSNTTSSTVNVPVSFVGNDGTPLPVPLVGIGSTTVRTFTLAPGATEILEAANIGDRTEGWVDAVLPPGVIGYGVFRQVVPGRFNQEAVVPLTAEVNLNADMIYDDVSFTTSVALVAPDRNGAVVTITAYTANGAQIGSGQIVLGPDSKVSTILRNVPGLEGMVGNRGWVTFSVPSGNVSLIGLRFGAEAFTSIPVTSR